MKRALAALALLCACRGAPGEPPASAPPPVAAPPPAAAAAPPPLAAPAPAPFEWRHAFVIDEGAGTFAVILPKTRVHRRPD